MERLTYQTTIVHALHLLVTVEPFGMLRNIPRPPKLNGCLVYDANTPPKNEGPWQRNDVIPHHMANLFLGERSILTISW